MAQTAKQEVGMWGEQYVVDFLSNNGYQIVERNYRSKMGEIDIIAYIDERRFGRTLVFIEVKTRSGQKQTGIAERAVGKQKRLHMQRSAQHYCLEHNINMEKVPIQFEQVSVYREKGGTIACRKYVLPAFS